MEVSMLESSNKAKVRAMESLLRNQAAKAKLICPSGSGPVWGEGSLDAALAFVGEAPGAQESREHRPFVGPTGRIFDDQMAEVGIRRQNCWITASVKCRPTTLSPSGNTVNRPPTDQEIQEWRPFLIEELGIIRPAVIVCLGTVGAKALLDKRLTISRERGHWFEGPFRIPTIVTFHPAYLRRTTAAGQEERSRLFRLDLEEAKRASERR
jgi:uracil-DNA glycosylase